MNFHEMSGETSDFTHRDLIWMNPRKEEVLASRLELNSGTSSMGMYFERPPSVQEPQTTDIYIEAMKRGLKSSSRKKEKILIIAKTFGAQTSLTEIMPGVQVLRVPNFPNDVMKALIRKSSFASLVTGDSSISLASSAASKEKAFIYEAPPWKESSAESIVKKLIKYGVSSSISNSVVFKTTEILKNPNSETIMEKM